MKLTSAIGIYFVVWWMVLFAILPFGIRNAAEAEEQVEQGNDAGAPVAHGLLWKAKVTTLVAALVFGLVYVVLTQGLLENIDWPFLGQMPSL